MNNFKERFIEGFLSFLDGDYERAEKAFKELYLRNSTNVVVVNNLVLTLIKKGNLSEAKQILKNFLDQSNIWKSSRKTEELKDLVALYLFLEAFTDSFSNAIKFFEEKFFEDIYACPIDWELIPNIELSLEAFLNQYDDDDLNKLQRLLTTEKDGFVVLPFRRETRKLLYKVLKEVIKRGELDNETKTRVRRILGITSLSLGNVQEARNLINSTQKDGKCDDVFSLLAAGKLEYCEGNLLRAYNIFERLLIELKEREIADKKTLGILHHNIGVIYVRVGDIEKGLEFINEALRLNASCFPCWYARAWALYLGERWKDAEKAFKALLQLNRRNARIWYGLGLAAIMNGKKLKSLEALLRAAKLNSQNEMISFSIELIRAIIETQRGSV
ncbi:MAG: tetratricopeptide repeat protein [Candidatus Njordarchaeales archaeon]